MPAILFTLHLRHRRYIPYATKGPAIAMEKVLAPRVVRPPWARRIAWNKRTMIPSILTVLGPNKMAPSPVPVIWEQLPVTDGIFSADSTNMYAPAIASMVMAFLFS